MPSLDVQPGAGIFTPMPCGPCSRAILRVRPSAAASLGTSCGISGLSSHAVCRIAADLCAFITGIVARAVRKMPTFTDIARRQPLANRLVSMPARSPAHRWRRKGSARRPPWHPNLPGRPPRSSGRRRRSSLPRPGRLPAGGPPPLSPLTRRESGKTPGRCPDRCPNGCPALQPGRRHDRCPNRCAARPPGRTLAGAPTVALHPDRCSDQCPNRCPNRCPAP